MPALEGFAYRDYLEGKRSAKLAEAPVGGVGQAPRPFRPENGMVLLEKILPAGRWGDAKGGVQVWDGDTVRITTAGRARVLHVTQPPLIVRPRYTIDGQAWMACWTDYPNNGWGKYDQTWKIGLSVPAGEHELTVTDLAFPKGWTRPFTPRIDGALNQTARAHDEPKLRRDQACGTAW